jgi:hypothetical protein
VAAHAAAKVANPRWQPARVTLRQTAIRQAGNRFVAATHSAGCQQNGDISLFLARAYGPNIRSYPTATDLGGLGITGGKPWGHWFLAKT